LGGEGGGGWGALVVFRGHSAPCAFELPFLREVIVGGRRGGGSTVRVGRGGVVRGSGAGGGAPESAGWYGGWSPRLTRLSVHYPLVAEGGGGGRGGDLSAAGGSWRGGGGAGAG